MKPLYPHIKMADGHTMSVQASSYHYCTPQNDDGPYIEVEIGYPTFDPSQRIMEYAENPEDPQNTVYGYVPVKILLSEIQLHGGLAKDSGHLPLAITE